VRSGGLARPVTWLNAGIDTIDLTAGALEARDRGGVDRIVGGSLALNGVGLAWWLAALARLSRR
jgi:hypothetical protein